LSPENGEFDAALAAGGHRLQEQREQADYDAWAVPADEAAHAIDIARTFVAAVDEMLSR
jgi:uncharacterized protein (UPF0332 family)